MGLLSFLFGSPKRSKKKASKKTSKKVSKKKASKKGGLFSKQEKVFRYAAKYLNRDLRGGTIQPSEVDEYIRADWDKDSDEYESQGVKSYQEFHAGVRKYVR